MDSFSWTAAEKPTKENPYMLALPRHSSIEVGLSGRGDQLMCHDDSSLTRRNMVGLGAHSPIDMPIGLLFKCHLVPGPTTQK
jgi:hypothetical protein